MPNLLKLILGVGGIRIQAVHLELPVDVAPAVLHGRARREQALEASPELLLELVLKRKTRVSTPFFTLAELFH